MFSDPVIYAELLLAEFLCLFQFSLRLVDSLGGMTTSFFEEFSHASLPQEVGENLSPFHGIV
jgi:hypothetical protein